MNQHPNKPQHDYESGKASTVDPNYEASQQSSLGADFAWALGTVGVTTLSLVLLMRLWNADLRVPFTYGGDALVGIMIFKDVLRGGWWFENPDLGAPYGQQLYDFPAYIGDGLHFILIKMLGVLFDDPVVVFNLFFLLSFPLVALTAFLVLRSLGIGGAPALVCSTLYAFAPYHFLRGEGHWFLAAYYSVPVGAYLVLAILSGRPLFSRRAGARFRLLGWASGRSLLTLVLALVVAAAGSVYYAAFTGLLIASSAVLVFVGRRDIRVFAKGGILLGVILGVLALNLLPVLSYWSENGPNPMAAQRAPEESELYGLKLTAMVLPVPGHRIDALADLRQSYESSNALPDEDPLTALGLVASLGFVWLLLVALVSVLSPGREIGGRRQRQLAVAAVSALLLGTVGGFSSLFAHLVTTEIRAWSRISIVIAFFAIATVALILGFLWERTRARRDRTAIVGALLLVVLLVGIYDQTGSSTVPDYRTTKAEFETTKAFVNDMDRELPPHAEVLQLPYFSFPEHGPVESMLDYDLAKPYVHDSDLRWSYGATKGRPTDWQDDLANQPVELMVPAAVAAGMEGIYIDRFGYPDRAAKLESQLRGLLGTEPLVSENGRMAFFSLIDYGERLRENFPSEELSGLGTATLKPLSATFERGLRPAEPGVSGLWRLNGRRGRIVLNNPSSEPRMALVRIAIQTDSTEGTTLVVRLPDGSRERVKVGTDGEELRREVSLPSGNSTVVLLRADAPAGRGGAELRVVAPVIEDPAFAPFR